MLISSSRYQIVFHEQFLKLLLLNGTYEHFGVMTGKITLEKHSNFMSITNWSTWQFIWICVINLQVASELMRKQNRFHCGGAKVIVSCFLDGMTPSKEELSNLAAHMQATGADIIKVVTSASNITELTRLFDLLSYRQVRTPWEFTEVNLFLSLDKQPKKPDSWFDSHIITADFKSSREKVLVATCRCQ